MTTTPISAVSSSTLFPTEPSGTGSNRTRKRDWKDVCLLPSPELQRLPSPLLSQSGLFGSGRSDFNTLPSPSNTIASPSSTSSCSQTLDQSVHGHYEESSGAGSQGRQCSACLATYSSGNWYRDKTRGPHAFICKSCYVCVIRLKRRGELNAATSAVPLQQSLEGKTRRRNLKSRGAVETARVCLECSANYSSGDWYRTEFDDCFYCQKCYQRQRRAKIQKKKQAAALSLLQSQSQSTD
ncbi:hypothetical protein HDU91_000502 [Kappamyces sp. JEL0680]|nr:hypothetical protein HDU91_000502 [Kappamyces sp. JEL0680]